MTAFPLAPKAACAHPLVGGTLFLTQSRSAFLGTGVALLFLAGVSRPKLLYALPPLLLALGGAVYATGPELLLDWLFPAQADSVIGSWASRAEVWQRAWYMVQDFPYTGVGLNTFPKVVDLLYPLFLSPDASTVTHAHNLYLQTAVDLGIPGLLAFLGIVAGFYLSVWRAWRRHPHDRQLRALALGLAAGVLAHLVFGLTDAVTLGAKPGAALWVMFGLGAALGNLPAPMVNAED